VKKSQQNHLLMTIDVKCDGFQIIFIFTRYCVCIGYYFNHKINIQKIADCITYIQKIFSPKNFHQKLINFHTFLCNIAEIFGKSQRKSVSHHSKHE
jgi:hypothetical protein